MLATPEMTKAFRVHSAILDSISNRIQKMRNSRDRMTAVNHTIQRGSDEEESGQESSDTDREESAKEGDIEGGEKDCQKNISSDASKGRESRPL
jgi:hypothetical protein